jgi:hypothetical protein
VPKERDQGEKRKEEEEEEELVFTQPKKTEVKKRFDFSRKNKVFVSICLYFFLIIKKKRMEENAPENQPERRPSKLENLPKEERREQGLFPFSKKSFQTSNEEEISSLHSRRKRPLQTYKEPSLKVKMRRRT